MKEHGFLDWVRRTRVIEEPRDDGQYVEQISNAYFFGLPRKIAEQVRRMLRRPSEVVRRTSVGQERRRPTTHGRCRSRFEVGHNTRLDSLSDLAKHKANLRVRCSCGAEHTFDANRLYRYSILRCWNTQLGALGHRLRCHKCGRRGPRLSATPEPPTPADPFSRTEEEWKRLHRRLRS